METRTKVLFGTLLLCLGVGCSRQTSHPQTKAPSLADNSEATDEATDESSAAESAKRATQTAEAEQTSDARKRAEASFVAAPGIKLTGEAKLKEVSGGVQIEVEVENAPAGEKGIHIHQKGDCSDVPGKSMGEHYAVTSPHHGLPTEPEHHLGDLGNIDVGQNGEGNLIIVVPGANLESGVERSFVGKSIVVHESQDVGTDPSGNSGKPIACAVIRAD